MVSKTFKPPALFDTLVIKITYSEVLIYKNGERSCFYYFDKKEWYRNFLRHMADKNWFTQEMSDFITANIPIC